MTTSLKLAIIGLFGASTIGGTTAYGIYEFSRETIEKKLKNTLLTQSTEDTEKWKNRTESLKKDSSDLTEGLKKIKNDNIKVSDLQNWCNRSLKNKFSSEQDKLFKEIEKYCVYKVKEKIGKVIESKNWVNDTNNKKLKDFEENKSKKLSRTMKKVKENIGKATQPEKDALKVWCAKTYEIPFKGDSDQNFLDAKEFCVGE